MSTQININDLPDVWVPTPLLIHEANMPPFQHFPNTTISFKLESSQPTGCFKLRAKKNASHFHPQQLDLIFLELYIDDLSTLGLGHACKVAVSKGKTILISSSGGNAGVAIAYAGRKLGVKVIVVIPQTTPSFMAEKITSHQATVIVHGSVWDEANQHALQLVKESQGAAEFIHPFDQEEVWHGNSMLMSEIARQCEEKKLRKPDLMICVAGGGGLLNGVLRGLEREGWGGVPVLVVETEGARSMGDSLDQKKLVTLPKIASVCRSLGALTVSRNAFENALKYGVHHATVSDKQAVAACVSFLNDFRIFVEPACGAGLAALYTNHTKVQELLSKNSDPKHICFIVCGGSNVSFEELNQFIQIFQDK